MRYLPQLLLLVDEAEVLIEIGQDGPSVGAPVQAMQEGTCAVIASTRR